MKHITLTLIAATAALGVSAQSALPENPVYVPQEVTIVNPGFQIQDKSIQPAEVGFLTGWTAVGSQSSGWTTKNSKADGNEARITFGTGAIEPNNVLVQKVQGLGKGAYLLKARVKASRDSWRGDINRGGSYASLIVADQNDDYNNVDGLAYNKVGETKNVWTETTHVYVTNLDAPELTIGYGLTAHSPGIGKGILQCDDFRLLYFPNRTKADVENWLQTGDVLPDASNDDETSGITDITLGTAGKYYNLMGVEIDKPTSAGIYIYNGKKYVVK